MMPAMPLLGGFPEKLGLSFCCFYMNALIRSGRKDLYLRHLRLDLLVLVPSGTHIGKVPAVLGNSGSKGCVPVVGMSGRAGVV